MTEDKSARYHRLRRRAELAGLAWVALLLTGSLVSGGAPTLVTVAARATGDHPAITLTLLVGALALLHAPGALLIGYYGGYVLEHRYALSRQTPWQWLADHARSTVLAFALTLVAAQIVYALLRAWPTWWWLAAGGAFTVLLIALVHLAPLVLLPLFFRIRPLARVALSDRLRALAARAGAPLVGVFEWTLDDRTRKANAALAGLGSTRRILVSDTLLQRYSEDEIEVVLAHELAHYVHGDAWRSIAIEAVGLLLGFFVAARALDTLAPALGLRGPGDPASVILVAMALGAVTLALAPLALAASRRHERRADRFALDLTENPAAFLSAMRRLGGQNLAEEQPSTLVRWLFYSHPPLSERLAAARRWRPSDESLGVGTRRPVPSS
jgi:STE24 endopeptidase